MRRPTATDPRLGFVPVGLAAAVAAAPMVVLIGHLLLRRTLAWTGDQALIELGVREAATFHRAVGVYSRFGWDHPGPVWLYLLAGPYRLLGADGRALGAAAATVNALAAGLVVVTAAHLAPAGRPARRVAAALAGAVSVLIVARVLDLSSLGSPWNPYAVVLPALLFLLLAVGLVVGRRWWPAALLTGTFLVQTHIGTLPLVALVGGSALVARWVRPGGRRQMVRRREAPSDGPPSDGSPGAGLSRRWRRPDPGRWQVLGAVLLLLAWLPPLVDEVVGSHNISRILRFTLHNSGSTSWSGSVSVAGQLMYRCLVSRVPGRLDQELPVTGGLVAVVLVLVVAVVVAGLGVLLRERVATAAGVVAVVAVLAGVLAAHQTVGAHDPYLMFWLATAPLPLVAAGVALCWRVAELMVVRRAEGSGALAEGVPDRRLRPGAPAAWAGVGVLLLLAVAFVVPLVDSVSTVDRPLASPGSSVPVEVAAVRRWTPRPTRPLLIRIHTQHLWPQVAGLVVRLRAAGIPAVVTNDWALVFGPRQALRSSTNLVLDVVERGDRYQELPGRVLGRGRFGGTQLVLVSSDVPQTGAPVPEQP